MLPTIASILFKIFFMVALGFILKRAGVIDDHLQKGLATLIIKAFVPAMVLASSNLTFSPDLASNMVLAFLVSLAYYTLTMVFMPVFTRSLNLDDKRRRTFVVMAIFSNSGFIGYPLALELLGTEGLIYVIIYNIFYHLFLFTYGANLLSGTSSKSIKSIMFQPSTIASFICIAVLCSPFRFPPLLQEIFESVGACTTPTALIIVGCSLASIPLINIFKDKYSYLLSAVRLLILPMLMLLVLWPLKVPYMVGAACVVTSALPCASLIVPLSAEYDCAPEFTSQTVVQTMVLMVFTLPVIILLCGMLLT